MRKKYYLLQQWKKRSVVLTSDMCMILLAWMGAAWLAHSLFFAQQLSLSQDIVLISIQFAWFLLCGLYRGIWRFASIPDLMRIFRAVIAGIICIACYLKLVTSQLPALFYITYILLLTNLLAFPRVIIRWLHDYHNSSSHGKNVLIIGAGNAGEGIIRDMKRSQSKKLNPVAIVDDDRLRLGDEVHGIRILGTIRDIPKLCRQLKIELIIIAIPSINAARMRQIVNYCEQTKISFRTLPGIKDIADGHVSIKALREVQLEDLLGREQISLDWDLISHSIQNKKILVTGGGGSIGAELCRQISRLNPAELIIIDSNEFNLYMIHQELSQTLHENVLKIYLASVTDYVEMQHVFQTHQPHMVFHVAAYKHVPLLESHLRVAMRNNIVGTAHVASLSHTHGVETFVLISTDKAVNPTNIMGATKRASEVFCQNFNFHSTTKFITVRFGNVLDSAGSVIPLFKKQLLKGGPITITHPEISRYFMTIPEATQLILQAASLKEPGIFVLDMGDPINIRYLAEQLIKLSGKTVGEEIKIEYIGLRPGEKLTEELFHQNENLCPTAHPKIKKAKMRVNHWPTLLNLIETCKKACDQYDENLLITCLYELVPEYVTTNPSHPFNNNSYEVA